MAIAFGIFAIVFAFLAPMSTAGSEQDRRAAPYCLAVAALFTAASLVMQALH